MAIPESTKKYLVLAGCTLIFMPVSMHTTFGNILPYILSYYHFKRESITAYIHPLWIITALTITSFIGLSASGFISRVLGARTSLALGALLTSVSIIFSYFSIEEPVVFVLLFGGVQGLGEGLLTALTFQIVSEWMYDNRELATGLVAAGPNFYALIHMFLALYLINPHNKPTDTMEDNVNYFTDPHILHEIPKFFLKIGLLTLAIQTVGLALIQFKQRGTESEGSSNTNETSLIIQKPESTHSGDGQAEAEAGAASTSEFHNYGTNIASTISDFERKAKEGDEKTAVDDKQQETNTETMKLGELSTKDKTQTNLSEMQISASWQIGNFHAVKDIAPGEVLKSRIFRTTWLVFAFMSFTSFTHFNLYKQYAFTKINRDKLMVYTGAVGVILIIIGRHLSGMLAHRIGLKPALVSMCVLSNLFVTLMPISMYAYTPLYILFAMLEFYTIFSVFVFMNILPLSLFGSRYYSTNLALLRTSYMFPYILASAVTPSLIAYAGWTYVYVGTTISSTLAILACLILPEV